jgi:hypothetical protein
MTESLLYVRDENKAQALKIQAVKDMLTTGLGVLKTTLNSDPRKEIIQYKYIPWFLFNWDPHGSPDLDVLTTRYAFISPYVYLDDLKSMFPDKTKDIESVGTSLRDTESYVETLVEQYNSEYPVFNIAPDISRVQVHEIWYTQLEKKTFSFHQGQYVEDPCGQCEAIVPQMYVATLLGDLVLQNKPSPFEHNEFPFAVYSAYLDRYYKPFGIVRQLRDPSIEVNKRRSMALALMSNRRVYVEEGAVENINRFYYEANRLDGLLITKPGKLGAAKIEELANLSSGQLQLLDRSEQEIQETSGINDEALGQYSNKRSGAAIQKSIDQALTNLAEIFENVKRAELSLGSLTKGMIQQFWRGRKILRVTDRAVGTEKFIEVNSGPHNTLQDGNFDLVISANPLTDTAREKYLDTIYGAIQKAPAEAIGPLFALAIEIIDIPNKEQALDQIREATGVDPLDLSMTREERQQKVSQAVQAKQAHQDEMQQLATQKEQLMLRQEEAKARKFEAEAQAALIKAQAVKEDVAQKGYQIGAQVQKMLEAEPSQDVFSDRASKASRDNDKAASLDKYQ